MFNIKPSFLMDAKKVSEQNTQFETSSTPKYLDFCAISEVLEDKFQTQLQRLKEDMLKLDTEPIFCDEPRDTEVTSINSPELKKVAEIISSITKLLENKFKERDLHQLMPQSFFDQQIQKISYTLENKFQEFRRSPKLNKSKYEENNEDSCQKYQRGKHKLPKAAKKILSNWYIHHKEDPYPSFDEKKKLAEEAGINIKQVNNWFINTRGRTCMKGHKSSNFVCEIKKKLENHSKQIQEMK